MVYGTCLENKRGASPRGFESYSLRLIIQIIVIWIIFYPGTVAERSIAAVSKAVVGQPTGGSNPSRSAETNLISYDGDK